MRSLSENEDDDDDNTSPLLLLAIFAMVLAALVMMVVILLTVSLVGMRELLGAVPMPKASCSQEATTLTCGRGPGVKRCREVSTKKSSNRNQSNAPAITQNNWGGRKKFMVKSCMIEI